MKCVRGTLSESTFERDNSTEIVIVTDKGKSLAWQDNKEVILKESGEGKDFGEAKEYCEFLSLGGHNDWRMPTIKELLSTVNFEDTTKSAFKNNNDSLVYYWSSTNAQYYLTLYKKDHYYGLPGSFFEYVTVRCVRDL